jgi:hypothetical protein
VTELEARAMEWIAPYEQAEHLRRTRDWVVKLDPGASEAMRLAALTHDIERHFPGGPRLDKAAGRWDDHDYLFAHSTRSGDMVRAWIAGQAARPDPELLREVRRLILLHELGGDRDADLVQAADSLSYLETLGPLTAEWVRAGVCGPEAACTKLQWMFERIRDERTRALAAPLLAGALELIPGQEVTP